MHHACCSTCSETADEAKVRATQCGGSVGLRGPQNLNRTGGEWIVSIDWYRSTHHLVARTPSFEPVGLMRCAMHVDGGAFSMNKGRPAIPIICSGSFWARALFRYLNSPLNSTIKKKIPHHIKISAHICNIKCKWNQKLITQFCCTLRDEYFKPN
jgi:hypothetical protein